MFPNNLRIKAEALYSSGMTIRSIASLEGMPSRMTVWRWVNGRHDGQGPEKGPFGDGRAQMEVRVEDDGPVYPDIGPEDKDALIERLTLENDILRELHEVLKAPALGSLTNREKTLLIDRLRAKAKWSLRELTVSLGISKSSYEYWRKALARGEKYAWLRPLVAEEFEAEKGVRGYRVVHERLRRRGVTVSEKVVRRIMREGNLEVRRGKKRRYSSYAGEVDEAPANLPLLADGKHDFRAGAPNEKWVTDITEFKLPDDSRKVYLSPIVDLFDGKPVSWSIGFHPTAELANSSLLAACATLAPGERPFCHSDRGGHYRWDGWKGICGSFGIVRSMSRKGRSPDNAAAEGFFGLLKNEFFYPCDWRKVTGEEFVRRLDGWLRDYSTKRLKAFRENGRTVYDTIDNRRRRLGLAA